jgi:hypothetical protein
MTFCALMLSAALTYSTTMSIYMAAFPSSDVISAIKIYYGSQIGSYTNSITVTNWTWTTNAPFLGRDLMTCFKGSLLSSYVKIPIDGLVLGQRFCCKVNYIWKDGHEDTTFEMPCVVSVLDNSNSFIFPNPPIGLKVH